VGELPSPDLSALDLSLRAILSTAFDAAIAMREDGSIAAWNHIAARMFGWTSAEASGRLLSELIIPPEFRARHEGSLHRYLRTGVARSLGTHIEVSAMDRAGRAFPALLSTSELVHDGERVFVGFIRDISVQKQTEAKVAEVSERLELAVRAHSIGVFDADPETGAVHWNEELERIYGYEPGGFERSLPAWRGHVFPEDLARIDAEFEQALRDRASELTYSYRMTRCDGAVRYIEGSTRLLYDGAGRQFRRVGVNIDVTDRKTVEASLSETQAELIHVARFNSLGAMASSLGHELNQPLQAVANYIAAAEMALYRKPVPGVETAAEALKLASSGIERAGELIKRLRRMSSKGEMKPRRVDLAELLTESASLALHDARLNRVALDLAVEPEADKVYADPILLQQVVFNLLRNAAEAMSSTGGKIIVRASLKSAGEVMVEVEDSGPGLDADIASNLFTAFISTKSDGMGVGLSICRTIIEKSGGRIWASSDQGGTSFFFTLPRTARALDRSTPAGSAAI
jgi:two-component system sensor kinase FixL